MYLNSFVAKPKEERMFCFDPALHIYRHFMIGNAGGAVLDHAAFGVTMLALF